ncbi:alpha/beta hydrolase [Chelatococcus reniformis]|nr:alpha/beta hydrolase-fold protein [Chelatococcus reniformis]
MAMEQPAVIPASEVRDVVARSGLAYRIFVGKPQREAPRGGYPVLYVLDGNAVFGTAVETMRLQSWRSEVSGVDPTLIVAIGYPGDAALSLDRRALDYTPRPAGVAADARSGGADAFLDFIETELKPQIERDLPVDRSRQALFGHSFGGLFVLHALFNRPGTFQAYVAASPSIWWHDRTILAAEASFVARASGIAPKPRLLITVGADEQPQVPAAALPSPHLTRIASARMVEEAEALAGRLAASGALPVAFVSFAGENHASVIPAALSRALRFAGRRAEPPSAPDVP